MSTLKVNTIQNTSAAHSSTPEEIAQGRAKAWVNFDGTFGSSPFTEANGGIRNSFNVSSVTDNSSGDYTINFTNDMQNVNYSAVYTISEQNSTSTHGYPYLNTFNKNNNRIRVFADSNSTTLVDKDIVTAAFFGD